MDFRNSQNNRPASYGQRFAKQTFNGLTIVFLFVVVLLLASLLKFVRNIDIATERREASLYCHMVYVDAWPDYRHEYARNCTPDGDLRPDVGRK
jgi:hypothetical protein